MKICVVVPSEDYLKRAGVRIRYRRIATFLQVAGHRLTLLPVGEFKKIDHDVYLFSKCFDANALVIAQMAASHGRIVGVDLFDDYFSQKDDSRFQRLRGWLTGALTNADFVLCSTPVMRRVAEQYAPTVPAFVMNDPYEPYDIESLRRQLTRKHAGLWAKSMLNVAWYGMGDNPHFPVGLSDLVAFSDELDAMQGRGFDVRLTVLTNARAMTGDGLAALSALPLPYEVREWSEAEERRLLAWSHVVFLPVSAQNFSVAKSLNRAITALCAGNQVLSAGFPLYKPFDDFIYRDATLLIDDLNAERPRVRAETLRPLDKILRAHADPAGEARGLIGFLEGIARCKADGAAATAVSRSRPWGALVHGFESSGAVHKLVKRLRGLSVGSPMNNLKLNFDIRFVWNERRTGLDLLLWENICGLLPPSLAEKTVPGGKVIDFEYRKLDQEALPELACDGGYLADCESPAAKLAAYPHVMSAVLRVMKDLFPDIPCTVSENWRVPWSIPSDHVHRPRGVF